MLVADVDGIQVPSEKALGYSKVDWTYGTLVSDASGGTHVAMCTYRFLRASNFQLQSARAL